MATEMKDAWTDERLDDLNVRVDRGFDRTDHGLERLDTKIDDVEQRLTAKIEGVEHLLTAKIDAGFSSLNRTLLGGSFAFIASLIVLLATKL